MLLTNTLIFLSCSLCAGVYQYYKYIHNWSLQPFSQDCGLASHATYVVCFNFIHEWQDLQFNVDSERQIFNKLFMAILFTIKVFARNVLKVMEFSILQRRCHPFTRCIKKIAGQPFYNVIFYLRRTEDKRVYLCLPLIRKCCQIVTFSTSYFEHLFL